MDKLLVAALKNAFKMEQEDAEGLAKTVETIFKGQKEVEDMSIDKYVRALFYELQKENLLKIRREELKEKGKQMRKFYWSFNMEEIRKEAFRKRKKDTYQIYHEIPQKAWLQRTVNN